MHPLRLSLCTCNLWNVERWPERAPALGACLERFRPDVLGVQELRPETRDFIDASLAGHHRVEDDFAGWSQEGNLWWRADLLAYVEHGAADFGSHEPGRRLFWVRLRRPDRDATLIVATVHLTHQRADHEAATGESPRVAQMHAVLRALEDIVAPGEPAWVLGDFNDPVHPSVMLHQAGYTSCFADLGLQPPPTFPAVPTAGKAAGEHLFNVCYDWITANAPARAIAAASPRFFHGDLSPSDHWPVVAVYELGP